MNIVLLMSKSDEVFEKEYGTIKYAIEIQSKLMIERVLENYDGIDAKFYFIINESDAKKYKLENIIKLINPKATIIKMQNPTKGAACTALFASEYIANNEGLIIANGDQFINISLKDTIKEFENFDGGLLSFESLSPRYSYARINDDETVVEIAEKNPISKNALCGFYYFSHGIDFVQSATEMIKKDVNFNGLYYISPVYNEMILRQKKIRIVKVQKEEYHLFSNMNDIKKFEDVILKTDD